MAWQVFLYDSLRAFIDIARNLKLFGSSKFGSNGQGGRMNTEAAFSSLASEHVDYAPCQIISSRVA